MKLANNWYRSILNNASLQADDEGNVSAVLGDQEIPYLVDKKRLVLPTRENMARDKSAVVLFHPLSENILENESPVMARYRQSINTILNYRFGMIIHDLLQIAGSPSESANAARPLTPDQLSILRHVGNVDEKMYANWVALSKAMPLEDNQKCIVHIYIKKQAQINGKSYRRGAIVSFPLYEALTTTKDRKVFGVQLRKSDIEGLINTLKIVIPNLDEPGFYNRGSTSDTTPTIHALLNGLLGLAANVNALVENFSSVRPEMKNYLYDTEWVDLLNDPTDLMRDIAMIPHQAGNSGTLDMASKPDVISAPFNAAAAAPMNPSAIPPPVSAMTQRPGSNPNIVYTADGQIDMAATNAKMMQSQPQPYGYGAPPGYPQPMVPPGFGFGTPGWAPQPPMSGPMAARSGNGPAYEAMNYGTVQPPYQPPGYAGYSPPNYQPQQGYGAAPMGFQAPYGGMRI